MARVKRGSHKDFTKKSVGKGNAEVSTAKSKAMASLHTLHTAYGVSNVASLPFNATAGTVHASNITGTGNKLYETASAGVCAVEFIPSIGATGRPTTVEGANPTAPINMLAQKIYTWVRHENSGHHNYEPADLMMYILGVAQLHVFHAYLVRFYGALNQFRTFNRYYPEAIIEGMHFKDARYWASQQTNLRNYMYHFGLSVMTMKIPELPYINTLQAMVADMYKDEDSERAQVFYYTPAGFFKYDEHEEEGGASSLKYVNLPEFTSMDQLIKYGNDLLSGVINSEDCGIMSGDILKAYTPHELTNLELPVDYYVEPQYNNDMLQVFRNTVLVNGPTDGQDIVQVKSGLNSYIKYNPKMHSTAGLTTDPYTFAAGYNYYPKLIVDHDGVSPDEVMFLTQFMPEYELESDPSTKFNFVAIWSSNFAIATKAHIFYYRQEVSFKPDGTKTHGSKELVKEAVYSIYYTKMSSFQNNKLDGLYQDFSKKTIFLLDDFKYYPVIQMHMYTDKFVVPCSLEYREFDTTADMIAEILKNIHQVRIFSAFGI